MEEDVDISDDDAIKYLTDNGIYDSDGKAKALLAILTPEDRQSFLAAIAAKNTQGIEECVNKYKEALDKDATDKQEQELKESQSQEIAQSYRNLSKTFGVDLEELVYGEDGFMKSCYPEGFPDFAGDVIFSEKYWTEFEDWLKETKGIELKEDLTEDALEERSMADIPFDSAVNVGDKIRIIHLMDEDNSYDGKEGVVDHIDGLGQLHGTWGDLAVIPGVDEFEVITNEDLVEAKKDEEELPPDPGAVKVEVHGMLNNLVADEIEAIDGYEEAKADILEQPIEHKDEIISTIDHIKDEEKEHIDELIDAASEIPFDSGHVEEKPVEMPKEEIPVEQGFEATEDLKPLEESSVVKEIIDLADGTKLEWGWEKGEGFYVEQIYPLRNGTWANEFRRTYAGEAEASRAFKRYLKILGPAVTHSEETSVDDIPFEDPEDPIDAVESLNEGVSSWLSGIFCNYNRADIQAHLLILTDKPENILIIRNANIFTLLVSFNRISTDCKYNFSRVAKFKQNL